VAEQTALSIIAMATTRKSRARAMPSRALPIAAYVAPMKALGTPQVPDTDAGEWHCEIKFDGYRAIAVINDAKVTLWSRTQKPFDYPEILPPLQKLRCTNAVLDGEIVALDAKGRSSFQKLQGRDVGERPPIVYYVFDVLFLNGESTASLAIEIRRSLLKKLVEKPSRTLQLSPTFAVAPATFLASTKAQGLEGMILKRAGSLYESDRRSGTWLKIKNLNVQEFVIGGYTPPRNSRQHLGALLIGYYQNGKLLYAGKVGTGFTAKRLESLSHAFAPLVIDQCPFANLPLAHRSRFGTSMTPAVMRTVTWLKPKLVAQIEFTEWTQESILRHPVFLGLREDKLARDVRRDPSTR
jgi:bifunctional non-homologous end joining protein LigD